MTSHSQGKKLENQDHRKVCQSGKEHTLICVQSFRTNRENEVNYFHM